MSSKPSGHYLESSRKRGSQQSQRAPQPSYRGTQPAQHSPQYYRRHTTAIDQYLYDKGLKRKYIAKDGSCLFRAVSEQVWLVQAHHWTLRRQTALYIKTRKDRFKSFLTEPVDKYCFRLSNSSMWGGEMELVALSELLDRHIIVYSEEKGQTKIREFNHSESSDKNSIKLAYTGSNHYDGVWAETDERLYGFCQSLVYDVLYSAVFKNSSLVSKSRQLSLGQTMTPSYGPPDLLKALSMYVFSNIPIEHARMERNDREYRDRQFASSLQYKVGTICDVSVDNDLFRAEIIDNRDYSRIKVKFIDNGRKPMIVSAKQIFFGHSKKSTGGRDQRRGYSGSRVQSEGSTSRREEPKNERPPRETKDFERDRKSRQSKPNNESSGPAPEKRETRGGSGGGKGEGRMTSPKPPNPKISDRRQPVNHSKERGEREGLRQRDKKEVDSRGAKGSGDNRRDAVKERASSRGETVTKNNEGISKEKPSNKRPGEGKGGVAREEKGKGSNEKEERVPNSESEKVPQSETKPSQNGNTSRTDDPKETTTSSHPEQYQQRQSPIEQAPPTAIPPLVPPGIAKVDEPHPPINIEQRGLIYQMAHGDGNTYYIHSTGIAPEAAAAGGGYLYPVDVFSSTSNNHILVTSGASSLHPQPHPQPYFSEAPECEWPILVQDSRSSASSNSKVVAVDQLHPKSLHIDGPPPQPPPETMFAVPPTHQNVGVVQTSPHVATTQNIFSTDLAPPLHLLHNRTQEDKQVFMFEYAQQCLSCYFNSAIGDQSDLEDLIEELLAMSLEEFLSSPPRYSDGELSTTSPDNSELTDEREVTPLRLVLKTEETVSPSSTSDDQLPPPPREPTPVGEETTEETVVNGKEAETNGNGEIVKEEEEGEREEGQEVEEVEDEGMKTYMSLPHPGASPFMMPYQPFIPMMYSMGPQFFGYHHPYRMPAPMMFPPPYFMHPPPHIVPPEPQEEINNDLTDDGDTPLSQPEFKATPPESKPAAVDVSEVPVVAKEKSSSPSPRPSPSPPPPVARQPDKQVQPPRQRNNNNTHETRHRSNQDSRSHSNHDSYHRGNHERTSKGQKSNRSYEARYSRNFTNRSHQNQAKQ